MTAVAGVAATLEQTVLLQLVDQRHEPAGQDPELGGDRLLRPTGVRGDRPEQAGVRGRQPERRELPGEAHRDERTDLREDEGDMSGP